MSRPMAAIVAPDNEAETCSRDDEQNESNRNISMTRASLSLPNRKNKTVLGRRQISIHTYTHTTQIPIQNNTKLCFIFCFFTGSRYFTNARGMAHGPLQPSPKQSQQTSSCGFQSITQHTPSPMPSLNGKPSDFG